MTRGPIQPRRGTRFGGLAFAAIAAVAVSGCELLYGLTPYPSAIEPDEFALPSPIAVYPSGRATLTIDGEAPLVLDRVTVPGRLDGSFGSDLVLSNDDGWYVRVSGVMPPGTIYGTGGYVMVDRVVDGSHWTTADPSRCIVTVEQADATALRGTASCKGLRWSDAIGSLTMSLEPSYVEGQGPFDAEITFEASSGPNPG